VVGDCFGDLTSSPSNNNKLNCKKYFKLLMNKNEILMARLVFFCELTIF